MSEISKDDAILDEGIELKTRIINHMVQNGIPADRADKMALLAMIESRDRVALGRKKLQVDANLGNTNAQVAMALGQLFMQAGSGGAAKPFVETVPIVREAPTLPDNSPAVQTVAGEMDISHPQLDYDSFVKANRPKD